MAVSQGVDEQSSGLLRIVFSSNPFNRYIFDNGLMEQNYVVESKAFQRQTPWSGEGLVFRRNPHFLTFES